MIVLNALATRAGGAAVRVGEVARRAPALWGSGILLLHNPEARISVEASEDRALAGWPTPLERAPAVPRRLLEGVVVRRYLRLHRARAVVHYGTYVPLRTHPSILNVLCFVSMAPWDPGPGGRSPRNRILRRLFERTCRFADVIVVQSQATAQSLLDRYPFLAGRLDVVRNGVSIPRLWRPNPRRGLLVLGDVYDYRRIDEVVRAYASLPPGLRAEHPLIVAGNLTRDAAAVQGVQQAIAETGVTTVQLRGPLPRSAALAIMAGVRALVSYATIENGPNAIIEAAAMDLPTVVSDLAVHREFAGRTAYFAATRGDLTDALQAAVEGAERRHDGEYTTPVDTWNDHVAALGSVLAQNGASVVATRRTPAGGVAAQRAQTSQ